jgi:cystathionine gamma-synthase
MTPDERADDEAARRRSARREAARSEGLRFETRAIHVGQEPDATYGSVNVPIYQTSTFAQPDVGHPKVWDYARGGNPTREAFQQALASLEGGARCFAFASGLGAESTLLLSLRPGDHVVLGDDVYGGTYRLLSKVLHRWGLTFTTVDLGDLDGLRAALTPTTRVVWVETPTNPLLKIVDIGAVGAIAHDHGARVVVDNTFATPALQRPLALGADVVVHSVTKYIGGHSDLIGGAIVTSDDELIERLGFLVNAVGAVPGPMDSYLALRGLKTLAVRMRAHCEGARAVAGFLDGHPAVTEVRYPGLPGHPGHEVAARQMVGGFGGIVSFRLGDAGEALDVARRTELFFLAESLGGVESLIEVPGPMTHASVAGSPLEVPDDLVRLSVGLEHPDDLIDDLDRALS